MSKLIILVGESASGKTTRSKELITVAKCNGRKILRFCRDDIRVMVAPPKGECLWESYKFERWREDFITILEDNAVKSALTMGCDIIIDETNLSPKAIEKWKNTAESYSGYASVEIIRMETSFDECLRRDESRKDSVGRAVIELQFLKSKRADFGTKPIVLVDLDGTLCNSDGVRDPYDKTRVLWDHEYPVVCDWVRNLSNWYSIVLVSGRHASCGKDTCSWLYQHNIIFDHLLMRPAGDNRPDTIVKQEILNRILDCGVSFNQIAFVLDDCPKIINMWKQNGLTVYPVRGQLEDF